MPRALERLPFHPALWRGGELARPSRPGVPTGYPALDERLPGGGWPREELAEFLVEGRGIGELALLAPALARLTRAGEAAALIAPPHLPYAPAWAARGIELSRLAVLRPPARPRAQDPQHPVEDSARVFHRPASSVFSRLQLRKQRLDHRPLLIRQFAPFAHLPRRSYEDALRLTKLVDCEQIVARFF